MKKLFVETYGWSLFRNTRILSACDSGSKLCSSGGLGRLAGGFGRAVVVGIGLITFGIPFLTYASQVALPSDGKLVYQSDRIVVATLTAVQAERDPSDRFLGTLVVSEWLRGKPTDEAPKKLTLVLADRTQRGINEKTPASQRELIPLSPIIPIGEERIFFLRQTSLSGVHELTHPYVGVWPLEQRGRLLKAMEAVSRPKDFLNASDSKTRESVAFILGRRAQQEDWPFLEKLLRDTDSNVPFALIGALDMHSLDWTSIGLLERESLENPNGDVREWLMKALCEAGRLSQETFLKALKHDDNFVRGQAAWFYRYPTPHESGGGYEVIIPALIHALRNPKNSDGFGPVIDIDDILYRITGEHPAGLKINSDGSRSYVPSQSHEADMVKFWESWWKRQKKSQ